MVLSLSDLSERVDIRSDFIDTDDDDGLFVLPLIGSVLVTAIVCFQRELKWVFATFMVLAFLRFHDD